MWKQAACGVASVSYICLAILIILHFTATQNGSWSLPQHIHPRRFNLSVTQGSCNCTLHQQVHAQLWTNAVSIDCHCPSTRDLGVSCDSPVATSAPVQAERDLQPAVLKEVVKEPCPPVEEAHHIVHKVEEPWYAKGKIWHYPLKFPRCTMDACFNYSRCEQLEDLLIYSYKEPALPPRYFRGINQTRWHTNDPEKACLFFVFLDTPGLFRPAIHPSELPHWNGGLNHVLVTFWDKWIQKGPDPESIGFASVMISDLHETTYRTGFDVGIPLPPFRHFKELLHVEPFNRKYLLTFRGLRYINRNMTGEGVLRSHDAFRAMNNGNDIIIALSCKHPVNDEFRQEDPSLGAHCDEDDALYERYDFNDLMNSTFGLAPAGIQSNSYRFAELLSAGTIPVLIADNYVKPYETLVQWHKCILQFPSTEMQRIVPAVRGMRRKEVERRQRYCIHVYQEIFSSEEALLRSAINAQKVRFMGAFPAWIREDEEIY